MKFRSNCKVLIVFLIVVFQSAWVNASVVRDTIEGSPKNDVTNLT